MTAYQALALPLPQRSELIKNAFFGNTWNALKGGLSKTRDDVWNAGKQEVGQVAASAQNGLKSMATTAGNAINQGAQAVGQGAQAVGQGALNAGKMVVGGGMLAGQAVGQGAQAVGQAIGQGAQAVGQGVQQAGQAVGQAAQQGAQAVTDAGKGLAAGASNMANNAIDSGLQAVDQNISRPIYGALGAGLAAHGNAYAQ